jgi:MFS family permease
LELTLLAPLDRARRSILAACVRVAPRVVVEREPRVAVMGAALIALGFVLTAIAPLWLLLIGPLVLGVPHVIADVRYLVARPGLHKRWPLWILAFGPLVWCAAGGGVRAGLVATIGALLVARASIWVRAAGVCFAAGILIYVWPHAPMADLVFAHLHNFIAVGLWWSWRKRARLLHLLPLAAFVLGAALLVMGVAAPDISRFPYSVGAGLVPLELFTFGPRLVALYAFAQAVHYTVWLRLIPEEARERSAPRGFASSVRALVADVNPWLLGAMLLAMVGFAVYGAVDVVAARDKYLYFAIFHGHLELAAIALLFVEKRLPVS